MVLILLDSDNFSDEFLTVDAYEEVVLQMSTGDVGTCTATPIVVADNFMQVSGNRIIRLEDIA